jgi:hypothetical protein
VTVMFSDLVGSTALSARTDPEDLRAVISAYQKCVAETVHVLRARVQQWSGNEKPRPWEPGLSCTCFQARKNRAWHPRRAYSVRMLIGCQSLKTSGISMFPPRSR